MACIPARLAGVSEVAVASPPARTGLPHDLVLAAADLAGVDEVYACGGAQAIAALALGTESVGRVEKVFGPGNRYVTAAKILLRDEVAIDLLSGPSEVVVVADGAASATTVASDLRSQAEHGPDSLVLLIATSEALARDVARLLADATIERPGQRPGIDPFPMLLAEDLEEAIAFANDLAPEHLVLNVAKPRDALASVTHAGCVFLGPWSPVTLGDYCLGTNHSLPTMGAARWQGPLGLGDFLRPMAYAEARSRGLASLGPTARILAEAEGFPDHAAAITARRGIGS
jgi:histidinol dehydrogenase